MSPPGVEPVLPSWKVGVVTALPLKSMLYPTSDRALRLNIKIN